VVVDGSWLVVRDSLAGCGGLLPVVGGSVRMGVVCVFFLSEVLGVAGGGLLASGKAWGVS